MESILDSNKDFDIQLFDRVVEAFYKGHGKEQNDAQTILTKFQADNNSWQRTDQILQYSENIQSKFIALSILDNLIVSRWNMLPNDQKINIRTFIVGMILSVCNDDSLFNSNRELINKANLVLVQIIKKDWPARWSNFLPELIDSSKYSENICQNNLEILKVLAEEIFEYSSEKLTQAKVIKLKVSMTSEFPLIYEFCHDILANTDSSRLINSSLNTLLCYINCFPINYIFDSNILDLLSLQYFPEPETRLVALKFLTEVSMLNLNGNKTYLEKIIKSIENVMNITASNLIQPDCDLSVIYNEFNISDQRFFRNFTIYLTTFLQNYREFCDENRSFDDLMIALHICLMKLSYINEKENFKIVLDYWHNFVADLYHEIQRLPIFDLATAASSGAVNPSFYKNFPLTKHRYDDICSQLRVLIVEKMARPEEVFIVENDEGVIIREYMKDSDIIQTYNTERSTLVYLTHLDVRDTEKIMLDKLLKQVDQSEWSRQTLNTLCWAIGSISGTMVIDEERDFIISIIKYLLELHDKIEGGDNKRIVSSNIMYVVGQYPRFLKSHWSFLKTIIDKLFEFMHDKNSGVRDMACDTFIKISQKCKGSFLTTQPYQSDPLIETIISDIINITCDLEPQQVLIFYHACGIIVAVQGKQATRRQLLSNLLELPNTTWSLITKKHGLNTNEFWDMEKIKIVANIIRINTVVCSELHTSFCTQLIHIYPYLLKIYDSITAIISEKISTNGDSVIKTPFLRGLRTIKKEILKLVLSYVSEATNLNDVVEDLIDPLLPLVLRNYIDSTPNARDYEVLSCMAGIVKRIGHENPKISLIIFRNIFETTLDMINKELVEYPEYRIEFYKFLHSVTAVAFSIFAELPAFEFNLFMNSIFWSFKHKILEVELEGLQITIELLHNFENMEGNEQFKSYFYRTYYCTILSEVFYVITNLEHKSSFSKHCILLMKLFKLVENNLIKVSLSDDNLTIISNQEYVHNFLRNLFTNNFPQLSQKQIELFLSALIKNVNEHIRFKGILRDFLVQIKEYGGDPVDFLLEEDNEETNQNLLLNADMFLIAGMQRPYEIDDVEM
ncbi:hypothetical protein TPHA_0H01010 [Tetrapisispora phaffii CBS 4417]|uniref:Exportin-1 n=1 Tax=Tetrapisispora phaffii (strain ATCC 24235 / CBS 4417 / NBRC 1672 / NRRL Y-8282 / UCD 70-5) TaxID=1071381 RepID=G8BX05_TETPH|nr:hypothetical protein TPHA_0H01010 [Tetrapisispora phaffii CBS 4417]CCE64309.1 hypothetical protein TPHA_0H01010 [Tetrapisispora phaffii CBS 4417]